MSPLPQCLQVDVYKRQMMIKACTRMLEKIGVSAQQIAYDEF